MSRLNSVIQSVKERVGGHDAPPVTPMKKGSNLSVSINKARAVMNGGDVLEKGIHDAMYHHRCHAMAAGRASTGPEDAGGMSRRRESERQHTYMFLRHALENARGRNAYDMIDCLRRAIDYYGNEASAQVYSHDASEIDPYVAHFEHGGGFMPHEDDAHFSDEAK